MIYARFIRFLFPLVLAMIALELGGQFLNGGMARVPRPTETLAAFGLAWGLMNFLTCSLWQIRQVGLVLAESRQATVSVFRFAVLLSVSMAGVLGLLALTPLGLWVVEGLHGVDPSLGAVVRYAILLVVPMPLITGGTHLCSGILLRVRRTEVVSAATVCSIGASIASVFLLLPVGFIQEEPISLPVLVTYIGVTVELAIVFVGYLRFARPVLSSGGTAPGVPYVARFFWPLALIMGVQGLSRPLINLFVARSSGGEDALAVLTVVYALGHLPYSWLNETRNLAPAFKDADGGLKSIRRFVIGCCLVSFLTAAVLFWTPIRGYILQDLIGVAAGFAAQCAWPLIIFSVFPLPVAVRGYFHGIGLLNHRTRALAPSSLARICAIVLALWSLPFLGVHGATRGVGALFCGFSAEAIAVWAAVRLRQ